MASTKAATPVDVYIGEKIRGYRNRLKITQEELAKMLGISFQQVQKYEKGANRLPGSRLQKVCDIFKCKVSDLFPPQGGSRELSHLDRVLATRDGMQLIHSFVAIKNHDLRAAVVELARRLEGF
jgi:transcriptional regulator with XRE-family HTH domain